MFRYVGQCYCDYDGGAVGPFLSVLFDFFNLLVLLFLLLLLLLLLLCCLCFMLDNATVTMMLVQWVPCHFLSVAAAAPTTNHHQQTT